MEKPCVATAKLYLEDPKYFWNSGMFLLKSSIFLNELDIFNKTETGLLKISPFYYWTDTNLDAYMEKYNLVNEHDYFDPTKVDEKRECGLHNLEGK